MNRTRSTFRPFVLLAIALLPGTAVWAQPNDPAGRRIPSLAGYWADVPGNRWTFSQNAAQGTTRPITLTSPTGVAFSGQIEGRQIRVFHALSDDEVSRDIPP